MSSAACQTASMSCQLVFCGDVLKANRTPSTLVPLGCVRPVSQARRLRLSVRLAESDLLFGFAESVKPVGELAAPAHRAQPAFGGRPRLRGGDDQQLVACGDP